MALSLTSKVLHWLGTVVIGSPASLCMSDDFYHEVSDRQPATRTEIQKHATQRDRLAEDAFRRALSQRVAVVVTLIAGLCIGGITLLAGGAKAIQDHRAHAAQIEANCARWPTMYPGTPLPDDCR